MIDTSHRLTEGELLSRITVNPAINTEITH